MDALVLAGGIPQPGEPLYDFTQGKPKALLDISGKPMVQWVLDALSQAKSIDRVVVVSLEEDSGLKCEKPVAYLPNQGEMLNNIRAGVRKVLELNPGARHVLSVSSDIPSITGEMVDWMVDTTAQSDHDIYYSVITRQVMEARYPNSKRSYIRLKDVDICGGDMNMFRAQTATENEALWEKIIAARKNALKQAALIGFDTLFLLLFRRVTLDEAVKIVEKRLNITGRVIRSPYAEIGMDVDKPHQLEIVRADMAKKVPA
jgi:molybdopterin-guanine dinucleotide biosynthesis protein A